jgi:pimeloyl-ACP methyl ester carboxylesterase
MTSSSKTEVDKMAAQTVPQIESGTNTSFPSLKQIDAGALSVGYAEVGPVVILLHGWPYDIHAYVDVAPVLGSAGYRVIVPFLRGFGPTRFVSDEAFRDGEQLAFAVDTVALMDPLKIERAILAGYDYGGRAAEIVAVLWPERCKALVSGQGYLIVNYEANQQPLPSKEELALWFQYYLGRSEVNLVTVKTYMTSTNSCGIGSPPNGTSMMPGTSAPRLLLRIQTMSLS